MKSKKNMIVLGSLLIILIVLAVIYFRTPVGSINMTDKQVMSIEIKRLNKNSEINNSDIIDEIVADISNIKIKENRWIKIPKNPSGKSDVIVTLRDENKNIIHKLVFSSEDELYLDGIRYSVIGNTNVKENIKEFMSYCNKTLSKIDEEKVLEIDAKNVDKDNKEIINEYNKMVNAKPIREEDMKSDSEKIVKITTMFDETITIFYYDQEVYIEYDYKGEASNFLYK